MTAVGVYQFQLCLESHKQFLASIMFQHSNAFDVCSIGEHITRLDGCQSVLCAALYTQLRNIPGLRSRITADINNLPRS